MKLNFVKWKLMLTTLPITALIVLIKYLLVQQFGFDGLVRYSEISLVVTGGVFLIGFMLAGTMSDYKESEKIPAELACAIETIEDTLHLAHAYKGGFDVVMLKSQLHRVTTSILYWFTKEESTEDAFGKIHGIRDIDEPFEYSAKGVEGAADVDLFPLIEYTARAGNRLAANGQRPTVNEAT